MTNKRILLTGFEPFNEFKTNPSELLACDFGEQYKDNIISKILPVDYELARHNLLDTLGFHKPQICICMGLAKGDTFRFETIARKPKEFLTLAGELQYPSLIPGYIEHYCSNHPEFVLSEDCGQYVCEATLWTLLDYCRMNKIPEIAFFLHVPAICNNWPYQKISSRFKVFLEFILNEAASI